MSDENLKLMLLRHEGLKLKPYQDTVGKVTVGVGRNLDDVGISREEAMFMLDNDIKKAKLGLAHMFPWYLSLDDVRQAVMVDMTFNEWLEKQFNSGRIDREEFNEDLDKLREEVEVSIEFTKAVNEEFWNIL